MSARDDRHKSPPTETVIEVADPDDTPLGVAITRHMTLDFTKKTAPADNRSLPRGSSQIVTVSSLPDLVESESGRDLVARAVVETGISARAAAELLGISYRQIDYWFRTFDILGWPTRAAGGSGSRRRVTAADLIVLDLIARLTSASVSLTLVRSFLEMANRDEFDLTVNFTLKLAPEVTLEASWRGVDAIIATYTDQVL